MFIGVMKVVVEAVSVKDIGYLYAGAAVEMYPGGNGAVASKKRRVSPT